jgi:hypothetical protein
MSLDAFYTAFGKEPRLKTGHLCLYQVLYYLIDLGTPSKEMTITRNQLMRLTKISSVATYHKYINDLVHVGFIQYSPSYHPGQKTKITLLF